MAGSIQQRPGIGALGSALSAGLLLLVASDASATIRYVAPCGSDAWAGFSAVCSAPLGPKRTIQAAIAASADGDEIRILPGGYAGPIDLDGKAIHLVGLGGAAATIVTGSGATPVVLANSGEAADTVLESLTITGGNVAGSGGGMLIALASPTVIDCVLSGNQAGASGGGVAVITGSPHFTGCTFSSNGAGNGGGGVSTSFGAPVFDGCTWQQNSAFHGGAASTSGGTPSFTNCLIRWNEASQGAGLHCSQGSPLVEDSEVSSNLALDAGGAIYALDAALTVNGTDLIDNVASGDGGGLWAGGGSLVVWGSTIESNEAEFGGGIAAIGGADLSVVASTVRLNHASSSAGGISTLDCSVSLFGCTIEDNTAITVGGLGVSGGHLAVTGCSFLSNAAEFSCGGAAVGSIAAEDALFQLCTFSGNLGAIGGGAILLIEGGATVETTQFIDNAAAAGGAIADLSDKVDGLLRLRDCQFSGNHANSDGGAIRLGSLVELDAARCTFTSNDVSFGTGGAVWTFDTSARLVACELSGNSAGGSGGGVWGSGTLDLVDCLIASNTAGGAGGGIYVSNTGASRVANCTLAANTAAGGGAAVQVGGGAPVPIQNSIVWANGGPQLAGGFTVTHSIVPPGIAGPGCLSQNPKFVSILGGDYRLLPSSPAIDAALLWFLPSDDADLDEDGNLLEQVGLDLEGQPRVMTASANASECGLAVDMGAYEAAIGLPSPPTVLGDLDGNGTVGAVDLALLLAEWGSAGGCPIADLDGDGTVGASDLAILLASWSV